MEHLTIGELARQGNVNLETVRFYERRGLLPEPPRSENGYRRFSPDAVGRLRFIKRAQELGFSLNEIEELLSLLTIPRATKADVRRRAQAKLLRIEEKIRLLQVIRGDLTRLIAACSGRGSLADCPILASLQSEDESRSRKRRAATVGGLS